MTEQLDLSHESNDAKTHAAGAETGSEATGDGATPTPDVPVPNTPDVAPTSENPEPEREESILLSDIDLPSDVQSRVKFDERAIKEFAVAMEGGDKFPPIDVFQDGDRYVCGDGFHRVRAARKAGKEAIAACVHEGGKRAAILHSVGANSEHNAIRRTNADKRHAVEMLLEDDEWKKLSSSRIADQACVSQTFAAKVMRNPTKHGAKSPAKRIGKDGRETDMAKIGKSPRKKPSRRVPKDAPNAHDPSQAEQKDGVTTSQDLKQDDAASALPASESKSPGSNANHGPEDVSGNVAAKGGDLLKTEDEAPDPALTEPDPDMPIRAGEEVYAQFVRAQTSQLVGKVTGEPVSQMDAQKGLTDLDNLVQASLKRTRTAAKKILDEARVELRGLASKAPSGDATDKSESPTSSTAATPEAAASA